MHVVWSSYPLSYFLSSCKRIAHSFFISLRNTWRDQGPFPSFSQQSRALLLALFLFDKLRTCCFKHLFFSRSPIHSLWSSSSRCLFFCRSSWSLSWSFASIIRSQGASQFFLVKLTCHHSGKIPSSAYHVIFVHLQFYWSPLCINWSCYLQFTLVVPYHKASLAQSIHQCLHATTTPSGLYMWCLQLAMHRSLLPIGIDAYKRFPFFSVHDTFFCRHNFLP